MERRWLRYGYLMVVALAALFSASGCRTFFTAIAYMTHGTDVKPEYDGLKNKKVAVVCRPPISGYGNINTARELARQINLAIKTREPKIKVIEQQKVENWIDEHGLNEFSEVGKAVGAEMVVAVDMASLSIYEGQTLYRGRANVQITVYDLSKKDGSVVFGPKNLPQVVYPPNTVVPASEKGEPEFRRQFVTVLADQIGRHFYPHDPNADFAMDSEAGL